MPHVVVSDLPGLDGEVIATLRDIMQDDFVDLIETFIKDSLQRREALAQAERSGDREALRRAAHSFKGSSANIGARSLSDLCRQLEDALVAGGEVDVPAYLSAIAAACDFVLTELRQLLASEA